MIRNCKSIVKNEPISHFLFALLIPDKEMKGLLCRHRIQMSVFRLIRGTGAHSPESLCGSSGVTGDPRRPGTWCELSTLVGLSRRGRQLRAIVGLTAGALWWALSSFLPRVGGMLPPKADQALCTGMCRQVREEIPGRNWCPPKVPVHLNEQEEVTDEAIKCSN